MTRPRSSSVEGREFRMRHRVVVAAFLVGMVVLLVAMTLAVPGPRPWILLPMLGLMALTTLPLVAYTLTSRVALQDGVLIRRSAFGTQRLPLAEVRKADLRMVRNKSGSTEQMRLVGPRTFRIGEQREDWPALRDAILAELPPDVRPARRA